MKQWLARTLMRMSMSLWQTDNEMTPNQRWDTGQCCPRWMKEPEYHNALCWVYRNWQRRVGELELA